MTRKHNDLCVGIDLGTTNSVIATCTVNNGEITASASTIDRYIDIDRNNWRKERGYLLPSCVYYHDTKEDGYEPIVGDFAKKTFATQPFAVARSTKKQMGQKKVDFPGWKKEYSDQTPEEVVSRILIHLLNSLKDYYDEQITDAVITVPASFNIAQSEATLRAAELAGLEVREEDGSYSDDILISEPEAVIYDVLNQIQTGKINIPIDFSLNKKVMVFDIGGGTLDITLHDICRKDNYFDIRSIATNRFSTVAGDIFDETIAQLIYNRYINEYEQQDTDTAKRIRDDYKTVMDNLIDYAEKLKIKISNTYKDRLARNNIVPKDKEFDYGGYMSNGYDSNGEITLGDFEECLSHLLGLDYKFEDYKRIDTIQDDTNIIYPILNVLSKAAQKIGSENLKVDAVIMNGGMSRLYLIENRIASFFNLHPITINDPDKSVAQGASVYHYYLHQKDNSNLHKFYPEQKVCEQDYSKPGTKNRFEDVTEAQDIRIRSVSHVQNETLYLGLKGGAVVTLVKSGQDLPFSSGRILNFSISAGQNKIRIPIKQETLIKGEYQTIADGEITFKNKIHTETPVSIQVKILKSGIISIEAWISRDKEGLQVIDNGTVVLNVGDNHKKNLYRGKGKNIMAPPGTKLIVPNEISSFKTLIDSLKKRLNPNKKREITAKIKSWKALINNCGNPDEFAPGILELLEKDRTATMSLYILPVARNLSRYWTDKETEKLSAICVDILEKEIYDFVSNNLEVNANIEAIKTIGFCKIVKDCDKISVLDNNYKYKKAFLYAFAHCGVKQAWIYEQFLLDVTNNNPVQDSLWALGLSLYQNNLEVDGQILCKKVMELISTGYLRENELNVAIVTLGMVCYQVNNDASVQNKKIISQATTVIEDIKQIYEKEQWEGTLKAVTIANEFISGKTISEENEDFLLRLLDNQ